MRSFKAQGYTIIEVLVVIAVSALIFLSTAMVFRGRQQQVQFDQSVRDFESTLRDIMNDVSTGYYPANGMVSCDVNSTQSSRPVITTGAAGGVGTDDECLYVGKALHFAPSGSADGLSGYSIYNLVGKRYLFDGSFELATTIEQVKPTPILATVIREKIRYGIQISKVVERTSATTTNEYGVVALLANFTGSTVSDSGGQSQNVSTHGLRSASVKLNATEASAATLINAITNNILSPEGYVGGEYAMNNTGIIICLTDGGSRKASITLGDSGAESVVLRIGDYSVECN